MTQIVRIGGSIRDALLTVMRYVRDTTGAEPTQEELAAVLKSYFTLNEIGNQIKYQLRKSEKRASSNPPARGGPFWKLNLQSGPDQNILARAGFFYADIQDAIAAMRQHVRKTLDIDPGDDIIAESLKSSFILSEIKNQIDFERRKIQKHTVE